MSTNSVLANMAVKISANTADFKRSLADSQRSLQGFTSAVTGISNQLKGLVAGFGLYEIGRGVIQTTSEFQKFSAVLSNTLGSSSGAQMALERIKDFALTTPFEVSEVTAAYVRWANQGLDPTIDRMRKLGDVATSLGAGFEQTAEAFKDLAVGQTKRIEEIGISAQQANGKIQLSFKGVNLEIEKNAEGVQKALDVYSQLNGVLGTSDAVSQTLGGRISNLSDAWTNLMNTMGESNSGPLYATIEALTNITKALADMGAEMALVATHFSPFHDLRDVSKETLDYLLKTAEVSKVIEPFVKQDDATFLKNYTENLKQFQQAFLAQGESLQDINILWLQYVRNRLAAAQADDEAMSEKRKADFVKYVEGIKAQAKALQELQNFKSSAAAPLRTEVTPKTGSDFLFDSGALVEMANAGANALNMLDERIVLHQDNLKLWGEQMQILSEIQDQNAQSMIHTAGIAQSMGDTIGEALGQAISGTISFEQALKSVIPQIIRLLASEALASIITAGAKQGAKTGNVIIGVAAAAAGVAAITSMFRNVGSGGASSSSGARAASTGASGRYIASSAIQNSSPQEKVMGVIRGEDLWIILRNYQQGNRLTTTGRGSGVTRVGNAVNTRYPLGTSWAYHDMGWIENFSMMG